MCRCASCEISFEDRKRVLRRIAHTELMDALYPDRWLYDCELDFDEGYCGPNEEYWEWYKLYGDCKVNE